FLPLQFSDIADPQIASESVDGTPEGVSQTVGPDLIIAGYADEWVACRDAVIPIGCCGKVIAINIQSENFAVQIVREILGVLKIVIITRRDVEVSIRPEADPSSIVVLI